MDERLWTVGELAKTAGLTVRALHHYDQIGLLHPSGRSASGYRLYSTTDVRRLYLIRALRSFGVPLVEISESLETGNGKLRRVMHGQLEALQDSVAAQKEMIQRLSKLIRSIDEGTDPTEDQLIQLMEEMAMQEKYFTPEQRRQMDERAKWLGEETIKAYEKNWLDLITQVEAERQKGTDPSSPRMQELATHWQNNLKAFTGGDPGIMNSLKTMYDNEGIEKASKGNINAEVMEFMGRALAVSGSSPT